MRISDWSSDVCSSDLDPFERGVACLGVDLFLLDQPAELFRDPRLARLGAFPGDIGEDHAIPLLCGYLRDARAHLPRPDPAASLHLACSFDDHVPCRTSPRVCSAPADATPVLLPHPTTPHIQHTNPLRG